MCLKYPGWSVLFGATHPALATKCCYTHYCLERPRRLNVLQFWQRYKSIVIKWDEASQNIVTTGQIHDRRGRGRHREWQKHFFGWNHRIKITHAREATRCIINRHDSKRPDKLVTVIMAGVSEEVENLKRHFYLCARSYRRPRQRKSW